MDDAMARFGRAHFREVVETGVCGAMRHWELALSHLLHDDGRLMALGSRAAPTSSYQRQPRRLERA